VISRRPARWAVHLSRRLSDVRDSGSPHWCRSAARLTCCIPSADAVTENDVRPATECFRCKQASLRVLAMTTQHVPPPQWRSFLERFSQEHRAWLAAVHGVEHRRPVTCVPSVAIRAVSLEEEFLDGVVRVTFENGLSLCSARPSTVRVQRTDDGPDCALEIETVTGGFVRVAFRATARPEELDGTAPSELTGEGDPSAPMPPSCGAAHASDPASSSTIPRGRVARHVRPPRRIALTAVASGPRPRTTREFLRR
jgi:hypothetical protein